MTWDQLTSDHAIAAYAVLVSLIAVFFGPWISSRVARKQIESSAELAQQQIKASLVSANRQKWINTLRDDLALFLSKTTMLPIRITENQFLNILEDVVRLDWKIHLLINPNEQNHKALVLLTAELTEFTRQLATGEGNDGTSKQAKEKRKEIVALAQVILKKEWEVLKEEWNLNQIRLANGVPHFDRKNEESACIG
jgi:hypothetical protein